VKDAQDMLKEEECALGMGQNGQRRNAALEDAHAMLREEECAYGMGHTSNYVAVKDAQVMLKEEECV